MVSEKSGAFQPPPVKRLFESESEVAQSYLTLCYPMDCSLPGFSVRGIFQLRVLEWVAISFIRASSWPRDQTMVSHIASRCLTLWATRAARCLFGRPNIDLEEASQVAQWERIILPMQRHSRLRFDPWVRKILGRGNGNSLQYCYLENPMDRGLQSMGLQRVGHEQLHKHTTHIAICCQQRWETTAPELTPLNIYHEQWKFNDKSLLDKISDFLCCPEAPSVMVIFSLILN